MRSPVHSPVPCFLCCNRFTCILVYHRQPTEATVTTSSSQLAASLSPAARTNQQHALASLQAASATSPVAALARQQQLAASLEASLRPLSARITGRTMSAYPSSGGGGGGGGTRLSGGGGTVQLLSVPSFTAAPPVAFPPPGATVQMIQRVPPRTPLAVASSSSLLTGAGGGGGGGGGTTAATMVTHPQAHLFDPNIRFLPPTGVVPLAPQNAPTYQVNCCCRLPGNYIMHCHADVAKFWLILCWTKHGGTTYGTVTGMVPYHTTLPLCMLTSNTQC